MHANQNLFDFLSVFATWRDKKNFSRKDAKSLSYKESYT